jgi:hypothetical protein
MSGENRRPAGSYWQTWSHNVVSGTPRLEWNSISPLWIVRILEKNCRMWCLNLITLLKTSTSSGLNIYLSRGIYFTIGRLSRCTINLFDKHILSTLIPVFFGPSKQTAIIILNWSIAIHNILCYPSLSIPMYTIMYAMH